MGEAVGLLYGIFGALAVLAAVLLLYRLARWQAEAPARRRLRKDWIVRAVNALDDQGSAYDITQWLRLNAPPGCRVGTGTIYPLLHELEDIEGRVRGAFEPTPRDGRTLCRRLYERTSLSFEPGSPRGL